MARGVFAIWIPVNVLGGALALSFGDFPSGVGLFRGTDLSDTSGWSEGWTVVVAGLLAGVLLGSAQWLALRRLPWAAAIGLSGWLVATTAALTIGFPAVWLFSGASGSDAFAHHALPHVLDPAGYLGGMGLGLLVGLAQAIAISAGTGRDVQRTIGARRVWVAASAAGFLLGWLAAVVVPSDGPEAHLLGGAAFGLAYAVAMTPALALQLRQGLRPAV